MQRLPPVPEACVPAVLRGTSNLLLSYMINICPLVSKDGENIFKSNSAAQPRQYEITGIGSNIRLQLILKKQRLCYI